MFFTMPLVQRAASLFCFVFLTLKGVDAWLNPERQAKADEALAALFSAVQQSLNNLNAKQVSPQEMEFTLSFDDDATTILALIRKKGDKFMGAYEDSDYATLENPIRFESLMSLNDFNSITFAVYHPSGRGKAKFACKKKNSKCFEVMGAIWRFVWTGKKFITFLGIDSKKSKLMLRAAPQNEVVLEWFGVKFFTLFNAGSILLPLIPLRQTETAGWTAVEIELTNNLITFSDKVKRPLAQFRLPAGLSEVDEECIKSAASVVTKYGEGVIFKGNSNEPQASATRRVAPHT